MLTHTEKQKYFKILCNDNYPDFISEYIETVDLQRLKNIGLFCGCDYTDLYSMKFWYSRLDHSIATALMTWNFTKDKAQTLAALFHDLGTPAFSHAIDYLLNDSANQESSEQDVEKIILNSKNLLNLLKKDNIEVEEVVDLSMYSLIENELPKICIDRLEGILSTGLIWCQFWQLEDINHIYQNIVILNNEDDLSELGFSNLQIANFFMQGVYKYSIALQKNRNKFVMQFIADNLKYLVKHDVISLSDLYLLSEEELINIIRADIFLKDNWEIFGKLKRVRSSENKPNGRYYVSVKSKKRYVIPLVELNNNIYRLNKVSKLCENLLDKYDLFNEKKYVYSSIKE